MRKLKISDRKLSSEPKLTFMDNLYITAESIHFILTILSLKFNHFEIQNDFIQCQLQFSITIDLSQLAHHIHFHYTILECHTPGYIRLNKNSQNPFFSSQVRNLFRYSMYIWWQGEMHASLKVINDGSRCFKTAACNVLCEGNKGKCPSPFFMW